MTALLTRTVCIDAVHVVVDIFGYCHVEHAVQPLNDRSIEDVTPKSVTTTSAYPYERLGRAWSHHPWHSRMKHWNCVTLLMFPSEDQAILEEEGVENIVLERLLPLPKLLEKEK